MYKVCFRLEKSDISPLINMAPLLKKRCFSSTLKVVLMVTGFCKEKFGGGEERQNIG